VSAKDGLLSQRAIHARTASSKRHDVERLGVNREHLTVGSVQLKHALP